MDSYILSINMEGGHAIQFFTTITSLIISGGVFTGTYYIVKDKRSRIQIANIISGSWIWYKYIYITKKCLIGIKSLLGFPFSFKLLNFFIGLTFFYAVVGLAASEVFGGKTLIGNDPLLSWKLDSPGSFILLSLFVILLSIMVLILRNRHFFIKWITDSSWFINASSTKVYIVYWLICIVGWSMLGFVVWIFSSQMLFHACLIIASISLLGSFNKATRVISLITAATLPFILFILFPKSPVPVFLLLLCLAITPMKAVFDWLSCSLLLTNTERKIFTSNRYLHLLKYLFVNICLSIIGLIGIAFFLAFAFYIVNIIVNYFHGIQINWLVFYKNSFSSAFDKGIFLSIIFITSVLPFIIVIVLTSVSIILSPKYWNRSLEKMCRQSSITPFENAKISLILILNCFSYLIGGYLIFLLLKMIIIIVNPIFFGTIDLVRQLFS